MGAQRLVEWKKIMTHQLPTKGLVRVYNSVHPIIDIECIYL